MVVTDLNMKGTNGIQLCERIVEGRGDVPVIVLTAFGSFETAVAAIRAGAYDFISKPVQLEALAIALRRAAQHRALRAEVKRLRQEVAHPSRIEGLIGGSTAMQRVHDLIARVGDSDANVLITGESGTGKEVVARALHRRSGREGPFVAVNCAAMPEALLESELFGHVRGAFTDAKDSRPGLFVQARHGTLFLDEIGDMPMGLQPKLLRVLQERSVRPVGGASEVPIDVRILAATNRDVESAIEEKRFREDLFFRINVIHIPLPPLRARVGDILPLAQHFIVQIAARAGKHVTGISPPAAAKLVGYPWPGNVRELHQLRRARRRAHPPRADRRRRSPGEGAEPQEPPARPRRRRPVRAPADGRGREAVHPPGARRGGRQQDGGGARSSASSARRSTGSSSATAPTPGSGKGRAQRSRWGETPGHAGRPPVLPSRRRRDTRVPAQRFRVA